MQNSYFIAIIPPGDICIEITAFKKDFALRFASKHALKIVPHITVKAPFKLPAANHEALQQWFSKLLPLHEPFEIKLKNFNVYQTSSRQVVYVHVEMSALLPGLQKEVIKYFRVAWPGIYVNDSELSFSPHITVAYRDLSPSMFINAWQEYKESRYESEFEVQNIYLLQHNDGQWNTINTFSLGGDQR